MIDMVKAADVSDDLARLDLENGWVAFAILVVIILILAFAQWYDRRNGRRRDW